MEAIRYAIIDGAIEEGLLDFLKRINPPHCCLYAEPIQPDLIKLAPYLVEVTSEVEEWLQSKVTPWGIFIITKTTMNGLRQHLRKYLQVLIPEQPKPVLLRFYDPRNIWDFLSILTEWEKYLFVGPVDKFISVWNSELNEEDFKTLKTKYPSESIVRQKMVKISSTQIQMLNHIYKQRYINNIITLIHSWGESSENIDRAIIEDTVDWLKEQKITDDRSIRGLLFLFYKQRCLAVGAIPQKFKEILCVENEEGVFKAEKLLIQELGDVPL